MSNPVPSHPAVTTPWGVPGSWAAGRHTGEDYGSPGINGAVVHATHAGTVLSDSWGAAYGTHVVVQSDGVRHMYAHLSRRDVTPGQKVNAGDRIGLVGSTGNSTGPHLHYEERTAPFRYGDDRRPTFSTQPPPEEDGLLKRIDYKPYNKANGKANRKIDRGKWQKIATGMKSGGKGTQNLMQGQFLLRPTVPGAYVRFVRVNGSKRDGTGDAWFPASASKNLPMSHQHIVAGGDHTWDLEIKVPGSGKATVAYVYAKSFN